MLSINKRQVIRELKSGEKIILRPFRVADMNGMKYWGEHMDPRFWHYQFPYRESSDLIYWYMAKTHLYKKRLFAVMHQDCLGAEKGPVGYITLKSIRWFKREGEMGVVYNPLVLEKGYGFSGIDAYLEYCFNHLRMKRIYLRVASFNKRAQHVYAKVGFVKYLEQEAPYEEQSQAYAIMALKDDTFSIKDQVLMTTYWHMEITPEMWRNRG